MSYLLDKKRKTKKYFAIALGVIVLIFLFLFQSGIFKGFSYVAERIFHPVLVLGGNIGEKFKNFGSYFYFKNSLYKENVDLKSKLDVDRADRANYDSVVAENNDLKNILGRKNEKVPMTLAAILSKPNQSLYDTLVVDAGTIEGIKVGDIVFAGGNVPVGRIAEVYKNSSKVILFSNSGEKTQVVITPSLNSPPKGETNSNSPSPLGRVREGSIFMELVGRGGGNFEMILPRDFVVQKGDQVILPGITPYVVGIVQTIISDPRDSFQKALLTAPVNIQELKFVELEKT